MLIRTVVGLGMLGHGLIHVAYMAPGPDDPNYPFTLDESWLLANSIRRNVGLALAIITVVAFAALGLAAWGVPGLDSAWKPLTIVGSLASLALLVAFWHPRIVVGTAIDVGLLVVAVLLPDWWTRLLT